MAEKSLLTKQNLSLKLLRKDREGKKLNNCQKIQ